MTERQMYRVAYRTLRDKSHGPRSFKRAREAVQTAAFDQGEGYVIGRAILVTINAERVLRAREATVLDPKAERIRRAGQRRASRVFAAMTGQPKRPSCDCGAPASECHFRGEALRVYACDRCHVRAGR